MMKKQDVVRNVSIAGVAAIPFAGGSISFLLDKYIPSKAERCRNAYLKQLSDDIEMLKNKVELNNLDTPEFHSIFTKLLKASMEEYRKEKINAFRNLTLNALNEPEKFDKLDFFTRLTIQLIPDQLMILRVFYLLDVKKDPLLEEANVDRDIYAILSKLYHLEDRNYILALLIDCMRFSLLSSSKKITGKEGRKGLFLTDLGKEYLTYILLPEESKDNEEE